MCLTCDSHISASNLWIYIAKGHLLVLDDDDDDDDEIAYFTVR